MKIEYINTGPTLKNGLLTELTQDFLLKFAILMLLTWDDGLINLVNFLNKLTIFIKIPELDINNINVEVY